MSTVIRLTRQGRKNAPYYRVVVSEKKYARDGRFIEILGNYNPKTKEVKINKERVEYFKSKGAKPSLVVERLLKKD